MTAGAAVEDARLALRRPQHHTVAELRHACAVLITHGDWIDVNRAELLRAALDEHDAQRKSRRARVNRIMRRVIVVLLIVNLALFATAAGLRHWADARVHEGGPANGAPR